MATILEQIAIERRRRLSLGRTVQNPPPTNGGPVPINSGSGILAQMRANVARRNSMMAPQRYELADKADEDMGLLQAAGVTGLSTALKILDIINTPQQMIFGAVIGLNEGSSFANTPSKASL